VGKVFLRWSDGDYLVCDRAYRGRVFLGVDQMSEFRQTSNPRVFLKDSKLYALVQRRIRTTFTPDGTKTEDTSIYTPYVYGSKPPYPKAVQSRPATPMKKIYKYVFEINDEEQEFDWYAPNGLAPFVAMQHDMVCLWQVVGQFAVPARRVCKVVGTGQPFTDDWSRIGTAIDGGLVWHLLLKKQ
jgi:hypothetical protein